MLATNSHLLYLFHQSFLNISLWMREFRKKTDYLRFKFLKALESESFLQTIVRHQTLISQSFNSSSPFVHCPCIFHVWTKVIIFCRHTKSLFTVHPNAYKVLEKSKIQEPHLALENHRKQFKVWELSKFCMFLQMQGQSSLHQSCALQACKIILRSSYQLARVTMTPNNKNLSQHCDPKSVVSHLNYDMIYANTERHSGSVA